MRGKLAQADVYRGRMGEKRVRGPAEAVNAGEPSKPRPAASIVLLRRGGKHDDQGLEILMLRRGADARFMPGVWVFPGGSVDPADGEGEEGHRACARRELREEAGIDLREDAELVLFSRWVTPEVISTRFDAWFFLALAPSHSTPRPDGRETTEAAWVRPSSALEAHAAGEMTLAFPTVRQLESLALFETSEAALATYRDAQVGPILPKVIGSEDAPRVVLPGEPDYPV